MISVEVGIVSMKSKLPLLVIVSCQKHIEQRKILNECLSKKDIDYIIFTGGNEFIETKNNVQLKVEDTYEHLHLKIASLLEYVSKFKRSILKIDDDSFIDINAFKSFEFNFDYGGFFADNHKGTYTYHISKVSKDFATPINDNSDYKFAFGGGYYLSRKAQKVFLENYKNIDEYSYHLKGLKGREDRLIGKSLQGSKLKFKSFGYWLNDKTFSTFNDMVFHPIDYNRFKLLFSKKAPKYYLNDIKRVSLQNQ